MYLSMGIKIISNPIDKFFFPKNYHIFSHYVKRLNVHFSNYQINQLDLLNIF